MCRRAQCSECGRPTFSGCGAHIEAVLGDVPPAERCRCREQKQEAAAAEPAKAGGSWRDKLWPKGSDK